MGNPRLIVCDLGGVLIQYSWERATAAWAAAASVDAVRAEAGSYDSVWHAFEVDAIDERGFFEHLRRRCGHDIDHDSLLAGWNDIYIGANAEVAALLVELRDAGLRLVAATNTNLPHQREASRRFAEDLEVFSTIYSSCEIKERKPDPEFFERILAVEGLAPEEAVFIDDLEENVRGAQRVGIGSIHFTGAADLRVRLRQLGVVVNAGQDR